MATRYAISNAQTAPAADCAAGTHKPSRSARHIYGDQETTHCTHCGCRLVKNVVARTWYVSGLMG